MRGRFRPWLFALLLVVSQVLLLVHEADVDHPAGDEPCQLCLAAQGLDTAAGDTARQSLLPAAASPPDGGARPQPVCQLPWIPPSRAPPYYTLHVYA